MGTLQKAHRSEITERTSNAQNAEKRNVAILLDNSIGYIVAYFAILFSGNTVVTIRPQLSEVEIQKAMKQCDVEVVLTNAGGKEKISFYQKTCIFLEVVFAPLAY